jgi:hypothetical protein
MPSILTFRRGTAAQNDAFTGSAGEITVDSTNGTIRVHDGVTAGGSQVATASTLGALASQDTITESQISDLGAYLTTVGTSDIQDGAITQAKINSSVTLGGVVDFDHVNYAAYTSRSVGNAFYPETSLVVSVTTTSSTDAIVLHANVKWSCSDSGEEIGFQFGYSTTNGSFSSLTAQSIVGNTFNGRQGVNTGQHGNVWNQQPGSQIGVMDAVWVPGSVGTWYFCPAIRGWSDTSSTIYLNRAADQSGGSDWDRYYSSQMTATVISGGIR